MRPHSQLSQVFLRHCTTPIYHTHKTILRSTSAPRYCEVNQASSLRARSPSTHPAVVVASSSLTACTHRRRTGAIHSQLIDPCENTTYEIKAASLPIRHMVVTSWLCPGRTSLTDIQRDPKSSHSPSSRSKACEFSSACPLVSPDFSKATQSQTRPIRSDLQQLWYPPPKHTFRTGRPPHPRRSVIHCPLYFPAVGVKNTRAKLQILTLLFFLRLDESIAFDGGSLEMHLYLLHGSIHSTTFPVPSARLPNARLGGWSFAADLWDTKSPHHTIHPSLIFFFSFCVNCVRPPRYLPDKRKPEGPILARNTWRKAAKNSQDINSSSRHTCRPTITPVSQGSFNAYSTPDPVSPRGENSTERRKERG